MEGGLVKDMTVTDSMESGMVESRSRQSIGDAREPNRKADSLQKPYDRQSIRFAQVTNSAQLLEEQYEH